MMKKLLFVLTIFLVSTSAHAAPNTQFFQNLLPEVDSRFDLGSTSPLKAWLHVYSDQFCLTGDICISAWPTGGGGSGGGTWSTTTSTVPGQLINYPNNTTDIAAIGSNSTTTAEYWFDPNTSTALLSGTTKNSNGDVFTQQATVTVSTTTATGQYTDIQTAVNALPANGGTVYIRSGTYTLSSGLSIPSSNVTLQGEGLKATTIQCNGGTIGLCVYVATSSQLSQIKFRDIKILNSNASALGVGLDISDTSNLFIDNVRIEGFATSTRRFDTTNTSLYAHVNNLISFDSNTCIETGGTQANQTMWTNLRCRPKAGGNGFGVYLKDARNNNFYNSDFEPGTAAGITNVYIDATSRDNTFFGSWIENGNVGVSIASGANNNAFIGGSITSNNTDISDSGTNTTFIAVNRTGTKLFSVPSWTVGTLTGIIKGTTGLLSVATVGTDYIAGGAGAATTTYTLSGPFNNSAVPVVFGASPITATYWGLATTTALTSSQVLYSTNGAEGVAGVGTTTFTPNSDFSTTGTIGAFVGGANSTLSFNLATAHNWTGLQTFVGATTTSLTVTNTGTSTRLTGNTETYGTLGLGTTGTTTIRGDAATSTFSGGVNTTGLQVTGLTAASCDVKALTDGSIYCGTDSTGAGGGSFPFTPASNFGQNTSATTTAIWTQATPISLMASSTAWFDQINVGSTTSSSMATSTFYGNTDTKGNASTTNLTISGVTTFASLATGASRFIIENGAGVASSLAIPLTLSNGGTGTTTSRFGGIWYSDVARFTQASTTGLLDWDPTAQLFTTKNASTTNLSVLTKAYFGSSATTTIDSAGNVVIPSGSQLTITGKSDGCATFASGQINSTGSACGSGGGGSDPFTHAQVGMSATTSALGIGTTTPFSQLSVSSSTAGNASTRLFTVASDTNATLLTVLGNGYVGVGTTTPYGLLSLDAPAGTAPYLVIGSSTEALSVKPSANAKLSLGSTSPFGKVSINPVAGDAVTSFVIGSTSSTLFSVRQSGAFARVGIGIASPRATLDIYEQTGTGVSPSILLGGNTSGDTDYFIGRNSDNSGTDNGLDYFQIGRDMPSTGSALLTINNVGLTGISSSTPWALLGVASSTWGNVASDYNRPLFAVATSSDKYGQLLTLSATSTTLLRGASTINSAVSVYQGDSGARLAIGTTSYRGFKDGTLDQVTIQGRVNMGDMVLSECNWRWLGNFANSASAKTACGPWAFSEDTDGAWNSVSPASGVVSGAELSVTAGVANAGAALYLEMPGNTLYLASSTPVIEGIFRIQTPAIATSTYYFGFDNESIASSGLETEPTVGCYFTASSTQNNWQALCRTSSSAVTQVNTGVASSSKNYTESINATNQTTGRFATFRIEADATHADFYIQQANGPLQKVASISTNYPTTQALNANIHIGGTATAGFKESLDIIGLRLWSRDFYPPR